MTNEEQPQVAGEINVAYKKALVIDAVLNLDESDRQAVIEELTKKMKGGVREHAVIVTSPEPFHALAAQEQKANSDYFGKEIVVPELTTEQQATIERLSKFGFAAHYLPPEIIPAGTQLPGQKKQIDPWVYKQVRTGKLTKDAIKLPGGWIMAEKIAKPEYEGGNQMYENDSLGDVIANLRNQGVLQSCKPARSRFGSLARDLANPEVLKAFADFLGIRPEQLRLETVAEYNTLGNMHYPERGATNTWEWLAGEIEGDERLVGGGRGSGGLSSVRWPLPGGRRDDVGFRLLVDLSK